MHDDSMNKMKYIAPEIEILELELELMLVLSAEGDAEIDIGEGEASEDFEVLADKRRGTWGNLWCDPEPPI